MSIKAVLFDLDGTLLPMDQNVFIKTYFAMISKKLSAIGYDSETLIKAIWAGTDDMIKNSGELTNEEVFWNRFTKIFGEKALNDRSRFEEFYINDFDNVRVSAGFSEYSKEAISILDKKGIRKVLATNPIFPAIATHKRIAWAGLTPDDFEYISTYENSRYCKPNLKYYEDILKQINLEPHECIMIGNDVGEDMIAEKLGMQVFLLTDYIINKDGVDISQYKNGNYECLTEYLRSL